MMNLGDLQQMTMLAVARLREEAFAASIRRLLLRVAGRKVAVPTVYVTLVRLEERGLLESTEAPCGGDHGGRARRVFRLTPAGWRALNQSRRAMSRMWEGVVQQ